MSSEALIAVENHNGSIDSVMCENTEFNNTGQILLDHYPTLKRVKKLIKLGLLCELGLTPNPDYLTQEYICDKDKFADLSSMEQEQISIERIGTVAYHRDLGGDLLINQYSDLNAFTSSFEVLDFDYSFLFRRHKLRTGTKFDWFTIFNDLTIKNSKTKPNRWYLLSARLSTTTR